MSHAEDEYNQVSKGTPGSPLSAAPPELPFVTTSDVLNQLNKQLQGMAQPGEGLESRFELQKRLPDGSTIPANDSDVAYSDLQTKLQQSAAFVAQLKPTDRVKWAEEQRQVGNAYFMRGEYKVAMDVYLTCLVVKDGSVAFVSNTLVPILSNLAQCTIQLGMHKKTIEFCNIAFEEISKLPQQAQDDDVDPIAKCKLHFKRAKARRLAGDYSKARDNLHQSLECLPTTDDDTVSPYRQAIQKEFRHLDTAEKEARKNRQRQKKAMQKVLSKNSGDGTTSGPGPIDEEDSSGLGNGIKAAPRQYSTLRSRKDVPPRENEEKYESLTYWQYYLMVVGRVAETILLLMGDEETKERLSKKED